MARLRTAGLLLGIVCVLSGVGCSVGNYTYTPDVYVAAKDLGDASVEVHIVGVPKSDYHKWAGYSMTKYWKPDDPLRTDAVNRGIVHVIQFGKGKPVTHILGRNDAVWERWGDRNVEYFFVLADLPGAIEDKTAGVDPRRMVLPALPGCWSGRYWGMRQVNLEVTPSGLTCLTKYTAGPRPE